jgi:hypothetical protein
MSCRFLGVEPQGQDRKLFDRAIIDSWVIGPAVEKDVTTPTTDVLINYRMSRIGGPVQLNCMLSNEYLSIGSAFRGGALTKIDDTRRVRRGGRASQACTITLMPNAPATRRSATCGCLPLRAHLLVPRRQRATAESKLA